MTTPPRPFPDRSPLPMSSPTVPVAGADHIEPKGQEDT
jgi:hypothetical protein